MGEPTANQKPTEMSIDISNPFSLHSSDQPGNILVSKTLQGDNYNTWSRAMRISLSAKNKLGLVDGTIDPPPETDKQFASWQRCNDMVLAWILNSVHDDIASSVSYYTLAADVWADLRDSFSQGNNTRIYQIKRDIVEHRQEQQSISAYYTKLKALWDELSPYHEPPTCTCGGLKTVSDRDEKEKVMQFLMGLNKSYAAKYHTADKCFYLNGFPPGHKYHGKSVKPPNKRRPAANQVKGEAEAIKGAKPQHKATTSDGPKFTTEEYNQIMAMLKKTNLDGNTQHYANATGHGYEEDDWPGQAI
ncbi:unnamed protein product [Malus baccata var. baccata]